MSRLDKFDPETFKAVIVDEVCSSDPPSLPKAAADC